MSFWDLFTSKEKKSKLSHLKNLVVLSLADGKVEKSELAAIASVMSREGLTEDDLQKCLDNPGDIKFVAPDTDAKKLRYISDMVMLMMVDGDLDDKEFILCKATAEALGYRHEVIDAMILGIVAKIKDSMNY